MTKTISLKKINILILNLFGICIVGIASIITITNKDSLGIVIFPVLIIWFLLDYILCLLVLYRKLKGRIIDKGLNRKVIMILLRFVNVFLLSESATILIVLSLTSNNYPILNKNSFDEVIEYRCKGTNYEVYQLKEDNYEYVINGYDSLTYREKTKFLYDCALYEASNLGVDFDLQFKEITRVLGGYYDPNTNTIVIRKSLVEDEDSSVVLYALFHEIYHCYCYFQVLDYRKSNYKELAIHKDARIYDENFMNYTQCVEDREGYEKQVLEVVANEFAGNELSRLIQCSQYYIYGNSNYTFSEQK